MTDDSQVKSDNLLNNATNLHHVHKYIMHPLGPSVYVYVHS